MQNHKNVKSFYMHAHIQTEKMDRTARKCWISKIHAKPFATKKEEKKSMEVFWYGTKTEERKKK